MHGLLEGWLNDETLTLRKLERKLLAMVKKAVRRLLVIFLERLDRHLQRSRDKSRYELRGRAGRDVETLVGAVRIKRRRYVDRQEGRDVYLLDERLQLAKWARVSDGVVEGGVLSAVETSFRGGRDVLKEFTGYQVISHETIRRAVLRLADRMRRDDARRAACAQGARVVKELFVAADGMWASLQGRGRGPREAKVAAIHEGWRVRQGAEGRGDYTLVRPRYVSGLDDADGFWERVRGAVAAEYRDIDDTLVVLNGDDAAWIAGGAEHFGTCLYQRDRYHVARDLRQALATQPEGLRAAMQALRRGDAGAVVGTVVAACRDAEPGAAQERLARLGADLAASGETIVDYRLRLRALGHAVNPGWRGLGAAEATVKRYKHRIAGRGSPGGGAGQPGQAGTCRHSTAG